MMNLVEFLKDVERWHEGYTKIKTPILINGEHFHLVPHVSDKIYSADPIVAKFKVNGIIHSLAKKGYRPSLSIRYRGSFPNENRYLIRFDDGEIRLCEQMYSTDTAIEYRRGDIIGTCDENIHYAYILLQGAGGGGSGSGAFLGAGGGAAGALLVACVSLENRIWKFTCGSKGIGGETTKWGNKGGDTMAECGDYKMVAPGGNGGEYDGKKSTCELPICVDTDFCKCVLSVQGAMGGAPNGKGDKFKAVSGINYGHVSEEPIKFLEVSEADVGFGLHGGGGGSSAFGKGGFGSAVSTVGGNGEGYGAGAGGAGQTIAKRGGDGGDGCIVIYY